MPALSAVVLNNVVNVIDADKWLDRIGGEWMIRPSDVFRFVIRSDAVPIYGPSICNLGEETLYVITRTSLLGDIKLLNGSWRSQTMRV